jgi:hypothetical protein
MGQHEKQLTSLGDYLHVTYIYIGENTPKVLG